MTETCLPIVSWLKNWFTSTDDLIDKTYPVGSIYMSVNNTSPSTLFGGTWEQIGQGRTLIGQGTGTDSNNTAKTFNNGETSGEYNHTLSSDEMPSHTHTQNDHSHILPNSVVVYNASLSRGLVSSASSTKVALNSTLSSPMGTNGGHGTNQNTGGGQAHNNLPPYIVVYMWKRTA